MLDVFSKYMLYFLRDLLRSATATFAKKVSIAE
jgi:hypothetical protein